jgi:sucrose phosphorylase
MKNAVQLITYADRLGGGGLHELHTLLTGPLAGVFGAVHILPFFDSIDGADAGFDPIDHTRVDPKIGSWADVKALAQDVDVMADVIVNHMSSDSPQFIDYSQRGAASPWDGLFLTFDAVFPNGATEKELLAVYRPRPGLPFTCTTLANGEKKIFWTTFTSKQLDIDVRHPQGRAYLKSVLETLASNGVTMIRLDAVGYAVKQAGESCFMMPATFDFIDEFAAQARAMGLEVLVEVHSHYRKQIEIAERVDWVYDFALPPLVLHAFFFGTSKYLRQWIAERPANALTVLDTHDGIGIIDVGPDPADRIGRPGLVPADELDRLVETIHANCGGTSREATGAAASNLDLYQVNCSFYDAMGRDDRRYLLARAIQFFLPGIPQVYYVGLLAGGNDIELLRHTRVGRDINRHRFTRAEVDSRLASPVVRQLIALIRLRNAHPAFSGVFRLGAADDRRLSMGWRNGSEAADLEIDLVDLRHEIRVTEGDGLRRIVFDDAQAPPEARPDSQPSTMTRV